MNTASTAIHELRWRDACLRESPRPLYSGVELLDGHKKHVSSLFPDNVELVLRCHTSFRGNSTAGGL